MDWAKVSTQYSEVRDQRKGNGTSKDVVTPGGGLGIGSKASGLLNRLAPGVSNCSDISPAHLQEQGFEDAEVFWLPIEVNGDEVGDPSKVSNFLDHSPEECIGSSSLPSLNMTPSVAIEVEDGEHVSIFSLCARQVLGSAKFDHQVEVFGFGRQADHRISGSSDSGHPSSAVDGVGVARRGVDLLAMLLDEIALDASQCCVIATVLLDAGEVGVSGGKALSVGSQRGNVLGLDK